MKEFIEKLIGRLEEEAYNHFDLKLSDAISIVNQLAEEYNYGWIPSSERLPEDDSICIVTVEYPNNELCVDYGWFDRLGVCWYVGMHEMRTTNIHAWQPLPAPYTEGE